MDTRQQDNKELEKKMFVAFPVAFPLPESVLTQVPEPALPPPLVKQAPAENTNSRQEKVNFVKLKEDHISQREAEILKLRTEINQLSKQHQQNPKNTSQGQFLAFPPLFPLSSDCLPIQVIDDASQKQAEMEPPLKRRKTIKSEQNRILALESEVLSLKAQKNKLVTEQMRANQMSQTNIANQVTWGFSQTRQGKNSMQSVSTPKNTIEMKRK